MKHILSFIIGLSIGLLVMLYNNYNIRNTAMISVHEWRSLFFQSVKENYRAIKLLHISLSKKDSHKSCSNKETKKY